MEAATRQDSDQYLRNRVAALEKENRQQAALIRILRDRIRETMQEVATVEAILASARATLRQTLQLGVEGNGQAQAPRHDRL